MLITHYYFEVGDQSFGNFIWLIYTNHSLEKDSWTKVMRLYWMSFELTNE